MIKRDNIRACDEAYVHHVRAEVLKGAINSLKLFSETWPDDPAKVIRNMRELLLVLHREKRKDAIRVYNIINQKK